MSETKMPATEANKNDERELISYEFAFHILPTVAEGEVTNVFDKIKNQITKVGGELTDEEAPKRFDLAYEIVKYLEGKNRKFGSAYFGWVRFRIEAVKLSELNENFDETKELLRFMLLKLTKVEEQNPFRFHDSIVSKHQIVDVADEEVIESDVEGIIEDEIVDEVLEEVVDSKVAKETV